MELPAYRRPTGKESYVRLSGAEGASGATKHPYVEARQGNEPWSWRTKMHATQKAQDPFWCWLLPTQTICTWCRQLVSCTVQQLQPPQSRRYGVVMLRRQSTAVVQTTQDRASLEPDIPKKINEEDWARWAPVTGLFFNHGRLKFQWDIWMLFLILYSCVSVPFRLGMGHPADGTWWFIEVAVSLFFICDLCITFNTAYSEGDQLVVDRQLIRVNYFRGWFVVDVLSSIPLELIEFVLNEIGGATDSRSRGSLRALRALRLVRMMRLLRLLKIQQYINAIEDALNINLQMLQLVKVVSGIVYLMHILGCFWFYLADNSDNDVTWITVYNGGSGLEETVWVQYVISIYWALTTLTTVGYGDIVPVNETERVYALCTFLIGALVFGYLLSTVADLVKNADPNKVKIQHRLDEVKHYLRWHAFPPELAMRVKKYYEFYFARRSAMSEEEIVDGLAPTLRRDVEAHLLSRSVRKIPLFVQLDLDMQLQIHACLKPLMRESKETIVEALEKGTEGGPSLYFVRRGTIEAAADLPDVHFFEIDAKFDCGIFIGEESLMQRTGEVVATPRRGKGASMRKPLCKCTFRARTRSELYTLAVEDFATILSAEEEGNEELRDEIAGVIWREIVRRASWRAFVLRVATLHLIDKSTFPPLDPRFVAALRIQVRWLQLSAARMAESTRSLEDLLPGLYNKPRAPVQASAPDRFGGMEHSEVLRRGGSFKSNVAASTKRLNVVRDDGGLAALGSRLDRLETKMDSLKVTLDRLATPSPRIDQAARGADLSTSSALRGEDLHKLVREVAAATTHALHASMAHGHQVAASEMYGRIAEGSFMPAPASLPAPRTPPSAGYTA